MTEVRDQKSEVSKTLALRPLLLALSLLSSLLLAPCSSAQAQQQAKMHKIGWLGSGSASGPGSLRVVFRQVLHEIGYVEGKNIISSIDSLRVSSIGSPPWLMSWSVSKLMCSSRPQRTKP
jgi:hypothetical protein